MKIKTFLLGAKMYLKKPWVIAGIIILLFIVLLSTRGGSASIKDETVTVKRGTVREEVSVTGKVKAAQAVDLSFEKSGKVKKVAKNVGDRVSAGDVIVQIDNSDLAAQLAQAQAALLYQQSKLSELEAGTRPEQLEITKVKVANAKTDLTNAQMSLLLTLQNAYSSADDAIRNRVDNFFIDPRSGNPHLAFAANVTSETSLESGRVQVENRLRAMKNVLAAATPMANLASILSEVKQDMGEIKLFMDNVSLVVNALEVQPYLSQTTITGWKTDLSAARTSVNTAITNILASEDKLNAAQSAYDVANRQLTLDTSGAVSQEIEAQNAQVAQAEANVASVYAALSKTTIKSPIEGIVTKQGAKVGETVFANTTIASVMSDASFEIEADIPEADIAKVKTGQGANVTLDAYSSDVIFSARIVSVDPAETIVDGVPTYKTTFQFENSDDRIKSGMTANIDVQGEAHQDVLYIPQRAIITRDNQKYVVVKTGKDTKKEVTVKTGLRGYDGSVEIASGLSLGDAVIVSQK